jgi:hypothetical protein
VALSQLRGFAPISESAPKQVLVLQKGVRGRIGSAVPGRRQAPPRLLARSPFRLCPGGDRSGGDARRFSARLRGACRQHLGQDDAVRVSWTHRGAVWQGKAHLVDGSRHSDRNGAAEMRNADPPVRCLVGTPRGRLTRLEQDLLGKRGEQARPGVQVKLLPQDGELYVVAESQDRVSKERAMRRRQLRWLWARLAQLAAMKMSREELLMKLGAPRSQAPTAWRLVKITVDKQNASFSYRLNRESCGRCASVRAGISCAPT